MTSRTRQLVARRPAETVAAGTGLAALVVALASRDYLAAAIAATGLVPAAASFVVDHGGLRGLVTTLYLGR